jgi:inositol phosphorylceramide mannosyltransferase catalytic subunit
MSLKSLLIPTLNQPPRRSLLAPLPAGESIPRILHQTFYDRTLPPELQRNVDRLRTLNPDWEYRFYDDADIRAFILEHYGSQVLHYFERIGPQYGAARADLFRYLLMYKVGGVYLDIKSAATRALDEVIRPDDRFLLSNWNPDFTGWGHHYELRNLKRGEFQQWYIACAPGHPFMKEVLETVLENIDRYDPSLHGVGKNGVLRVTGPIAYTLAIHRALDAHPHRFADSEKELGFDYNLYRGQSHETVFRSHYSVQTAPVVRLGVRKRCLSRVYGLVQYLHDLRMTLLGRAPVK